MLHHHIQRLVNLTGVALLAIVVAWAFVRT